MESEDIILLAPVCDNMYEVLLTMDAHPSFGVEFLLGIHYISMNDWLFICLISLPRSIATMWSNTFTINHFVAIWLAQDAQANKNYQPGAESNLGQN